MILTKSTIIKWSSLDDEFNPSVMEARYAKLAEMEQQGLTDNMPITLELGTTKRNWVSQEAAQAYIDFMCSIADQFTPGSIISTEIVDA